MKKRNILKVVGTFFALSIIASCNIPLVPFI